MRRSRNGGPDRRCSGKVGPRGIWRIALLVELWSVLLPVQFRSAVGNKKDAEVTFKIAKARDKKGDPLYEGPPLSPSLDAT